MISIGLILITGFFWFVGEVMNQNEIAKCYSFQEIAEEHDTFYLLKWQDSMCRSHGINIYVPVR